MLAERPELEHVLVFENRGEVVGVSNPHPHCQVYATNFVFKTTELEIEAERDQFARTGQMLFLEIIHAEVLEALLVRFDNLWQMPFPRSWRCIKRHGA